MSGVSTASAIGLGLSAAGTVASVAGKIGAGGAAAGAAGANAQMAEYQAQVARNNQIIANQNAAHEAQVGVEQAGRTSMVGGAKSAAVKSAIAASGIDPNSGSGARVQVSQRKLDSLDTQTVEQKSQEKVYGYRVQAANAGAQASLDTSQENLLWGQVSPDITGGYLSAGSTLLSGASAFAGGLGKGTTATTPPYGGTAP